MKLASNVKLVSVRVIPTVTAGGTTPAGVLPGCVRTMQTIQTMPAMRTMQTG